MPLSSAQSRWFCWLLWLAAVHAPVAMANDIDFFEQRIRPVLVTHCYSCHSAEAQKQGKLKGGLLLDSRAGVQRGGESGPVIALDDPESSSLLAALRYEGLEMPPEGKLSETIIGDFADWIRRGTPDPRNEAAPVIRTGMTVEQGRDFWSFQRPRTSRAPVVQDADWPHTELDAFVRARQEKQGLRPLPDATPHVLIRRVYFDLIGLPPSPDEWTACLADWQSQPHHEGAPPSAYVRLVDRLLASPHFGERWGRHWLDVARYADSNGRDRNVYFYHAWRYRNYVIGSFNADKPQDAFLREQVAGDLLPYRDEAERDEQRIATAFLALGAKAFEEQKPEIFRMDVIDEQIELIGRAVLGLSVGCARCHDHKFDPIPTTDYYALAGILRSTQPLYGYGPKGIKSNVHAHTELQPVGPEAHRLGPGGLAYLARLQELTLVQNTARSDRYRVVRRLADAKLKRSQPEANAEQLERDIAAMEAEIKEWDVKVKSAEAALQQAMDAAPPQPGWTLAVRDREQPEDCRIHIRGETTNLGDAVPRGMLQVVSLSGNRVISPNSSGRRELAEWLTDPEHPLTARVLVNRVWLHLFGQGLVATPDDFGVNGARPSHPELLDHLAARFLDEGWSVKELIRSIVLSRTYRLAGSVGVDSPDTSAGTPIAAQTERDPDNVYLWHARPRRLEAEIFRDAIRALSGSLDRSPPAPGRGLLDAYNPYREDEFRAFKPLFTPTDLEHPHRSVYLPVVRGVLPEMFQLFDFAAPDRPISQRSESIVPSQALFLMNSDWVMDQAREAARQLLHDPALDSDDRRLERLYAAAFTRLPTSDERARIAAFLVAASGLSEAPRLAEASVSVERPDRESAWASICQAVISSAEFRYVR